MTPESKQLEIEGCLYFHQWWWVADTLLKQNTAMMYLVKSKHPGIIHHIFIEKCGKNLKLVPEYT